MWAREVERMKANKMTRVPKLKQSYIIRDSWTRLNVAPAKIMQASKRNFTITAHQNYSLLP